MQVAMNLGSIEVMKRFVAIGLGLAIVPRVAVVNEVRTGQVVAVPIHGLPVREIGLVESTGKRRSAAATAFLQLLQAYVTRLPLKEWSGVRGRVCRFLAVDCASPPNQ